MKASAPLLVAALMMLAHSTAGDESWRRCDGGMGELSVTNAGVAPTPAHAGEEVKFIVDVTSDVPITGGTLEVAVLYLGFHVFRSHGDLCEAVDCPLAPGAQTLTFVKPMPKVAPPGSYRGVFRARDLDGRLLFCVDIDFSIALRGLDGMLGSAMSE